jgi:hypothetical protein
MPINPNDSAQFSVSGSSGVFQSVNGAVTLLAANPARKGATFYNPEGGSGTAWWYLYLGVGANLSKFTVNLHPGDYYELPWGYQGQIDGWPSTLTGSIQVEELV